MYVRNACEHGVGQLHSSGAPRPRVIARRAHVRLRLVFSLFAGPTFSRASPRDRWGEAGGRGRKSF